MKVLSVRPPWAGLIAARLKDIEIRTWKTSYRGPIAIHASKKVDNLAVEILEEYLEPEELRVGPLDRGVIVAVCELAEIKEYKTVPDFMRDYDRHLCKGYARYGWVLKNVNELQKPILFYSHLAW